MFCPNADVFKVAFKIFVVRDFDKQNLSDQENSGELSNFAGRIVEYGP